MTFDGIPRYQSYMAEKSSMYLATRLTCIETTSGLRMGYRQDRQISKKKLVRTYVRACVRGLRKNLGQIYFRYVFIYFSQKSLKIIQLIVFNLSILRVAS